MDGIGKWGLHGHSFDCVCAGCSSVYVQHNQRHTCECEGCIKHRVFALTRNARAREEVENLIAGKPVPEKQTNHAPKGYRPVATVNFCEKHTCEAMGKNTAMGTVVIIPANAVDAERIYADAVHTTGRDTIRKELCPGCIGELMAWLDAAPVNPGNKYTEPWKPAPKTSVTDVERILRDMGSSDLMRLALEASDKEAGLSE